MFYLKQQKTSPNSVQPKTKKSHPSHKPINRIQKNSLKEKPWTIVYGLWTMVYGLSSMDQKLRPHLRTFSTIGADIDFFARF